MTNNAWNSDIPVAVNLGGTGKTTLTSGALLLGNGTSAVAELGPLAKGSLVVGDGVGAPQELTVGDDGQILRANSGVTLGVQWQDAPFSITSGDTFWLVDDMYYQSFGASAGTSIWEYTNVAVDASESGHPGVVKLQSNASAKRLATEIDNGLMLLGDGAIEVVTWIRPDNISGGARDIRVGFVGASGESLDPDDGIYFRQQISSSGNWEAVTRASATETATDTGTDTVEAWAELKIKINAAVSSVEFYINGTLEATHTTNLMSSGSTVGWEYYEDAGTGQELFIDYISVKQQFTGDRA